MVVHICPICSKEFTKKSTFINHTENKKKPCQQKHSKTFQNIPEIPQIPPTFPQNPPEFAEKSIILQKNNEKICFLEKNGNQEIINKFSCNYCFSIFTRKDHLKRHINDRCKVKKLEVEKKENILNNLIEKEKINNLFTMYEEIKKSNDEKNNLILELKKNNEELNKKNEELNKKIDKIVKKNITNTQNITNNNNNNNTQIIINNIVNPFGKETYEKINRKEILKIMTDTKNNGKHCFNKLIDLIHFNTNIPENQNIYMSDYNRGKFMINDGKGWNLSQNEQLILFQVLEHVRKLYFNIDDEEFEKKFENDKVFRSEFNTTFKKYYDYLFDEVDDAFLSAQELKKKNEFKEMMNNEVKNKLYNYRDKVKRNYDKLENKSPSCLLQIK